MDDLVVLSVVFALICVVLFALKRLLEALAQVTESFNRTSSETNIDIDGIREELLDIVENTISNLQPPNAIDHLMGALAQFAQMKLMKTMGVSPDMVDMLGSQLESGISHEDV